MASPGNEPPDDEAAMRARLADLTSALESKRQGPETTARPGGASGPDGMGQAMSLGFRVMTEFVAAVATGAFIGWAIDRWLGTSPGFLIAFLALGTAAGFWNVYRIAMGPRRPGSGSGRQG